MVMGLSELGIKNEAVNLTVGVCVCLRSYGIRPEGVFLSDSLRNAVILRF